MADEPRISETRCPICGENLYPEHDTPGADLWPTWAVAHYLAHIAIYLRRLTEPKEAA